MMTMDPGREVMMMTTKKNYRTMTFRAAEGAGDKMTVEGYAAVFNQRALIWESDYSGWKYYEEIAPGAFDGAKMDDVILRYNHSDAALLLARTTNGTLRLTTDDVGLKISADIAPTTMGRDVYELIKRGDISQMSFGFTTASDEEDWNKDTKEETRRILQVDTVIDVAPVDFPAYDGTSITVRSSAYIHELAEAEKRRFRRKQLILKTYF